MHNNLASGRRDCCVYGSPETAQDAYQQGEDGQVKPGLLLEDGWTEPMPVNLDVPILGNSVRESEV